MGQTDDLAVCWSRLCSALRCYDVDRIFYARKPIADAQSFHNRFRLTWFSTYGAEADRLFVDLGGYVMNHTIRWALENTGAISWRVNRDRYLAGTMTAQEEAIHLGMREHGLVAGITYANPILSNQVRSGFGLCFRAGLKQDDADRIWAAQQDRIIPHLQLFELAASQMRNIPLGHALTERQIEILRLTVDGKTTEEMATLLAVHRRTIETHLKAARERLGVATTLQAAVIATQQGQL
ncbi:MAG: LuxR C-terminal-related transcriptional regulator [Paracoccaceae bacterium]